MYKISNVEIKGIWGKYSISTDMYEDVNIFIGKNGTGKTNFINILHAVLVVDLPVIAELEFSEVTVKVTLGTSKRTIRVTKIEPVGFYEGVKYKIGRNVYELPLIAREIEYKRKIHPRTYELINNVKLKMNNFINMSWLSVHREMIEDDDSRDRYNVARNSKSINHIDKRLNELMNKLTAYQLVLQSKTSALSTEFQKDVLTSMLYSDDFDKFDVSLSGSYDLTELRDKLSHVYQGLGIKDSSINTKIDKHIAKIGKTLAVLSANDKEKKYYVDDITALTLYKRTSHIIGLSNKLDEEKNNISEPIRKYEDILRKFIYDKKIEIGSGDDTPLKISKDKTNIEIESLSSGEKQLIILLTETLLQKNRRFVFIADEPELSLHIEWQRELLSAIRAININAQIIVATHSPEIAGKWRNKIIKMESIYNG